ncbi:MAG: hypothetical protein ACRAVC_19435 [Trichormus sp.]
MSNTHYLLLITYYLNWIVYFLEVRNINDIDLFKNAHFWVEIRVFYVWNIYSWQF